MIINIMFVHDERSISQMNIKLLSLNEENGNFESTSWRHVLRSQKEGGATIGGGGGDTVCVSFSTNMHCKFLIFVRR